MSRQGASLNMHMRMLSGSVLLGIGEPLPPEDLF